MEELLSEPYYDASYTQPKKTADEVTTWWERYTYDGYRPYKVKVLKPELGDDQDSLHFMFASEEKNPSARKFKVKRLANRLVWTDLPSTAQLASPDEYPYGVLFLSDDWAKAEQVDRDSYKGSPTKWPLSDSLESINNRSLAMKALRQVARDEIVRKKLLETTKDEAQRRALLEELEGLAQGQV